MAQDTSIEWTDKTWNPVRGRSRVSEGCRYCYAEQVAGRFSGPGQAYEGLATRGPKGGRWTGVVRLVQRELEVPVRTRKPTRFFVNSMSDLFHDRLDRDQVRRVFDVIVQSPQHEFQILTKRSDRLRELAPDLPWPPNLWMGVSIESRQYLDCLDDLLATPAQVKFLSLEPLLARMPNLRLAGISWVIVGGESGRHLPEVEVLAKCVFVDKVEKLWLPRPDRADWVREIRDACAAQGVPFLFKQWGGLRPKSAGRELDGITHDEFPGARRHLPLVGPPVSNLGSVASDDVGDWDEYPADEIERVDDDVELDLAILEGRRDPFRPVPVRRPNRVASAAARRRYQRASSRRRTLKLWSGLRASSRGRARCHRRRPRARRRVVRGGVGDDPDGPPGHPVAGQRGPGLGNKNNETPASSAPLSRSTP